ncbi:DUF4231 domain-containing protein [Amycolatopsis sp. NPDC051061]|uniref:DUF4231 domain-containing protein n=1 Tax=Amycolatopsis sp. NPDC051061 TaxID=3155042 RepID=UPI00342A537A
MKKEPRSIARSQWVLEAKGVDDELVPPSVLAEWRRYQRSSWAARRRHSIVEVTSLIVTATIPALAAFALDVRLIATVGSVAVLVNGIRALGGYKENWTSRTRARYAIEKEIALFAAKHGNYAAPGAAAVLVETVEEICAGERDGWVTLRLSYGNAREKATTS